MALLVDIPGGQPLTLEHLVLDVNGTITRGGELIPGVAEGLRALTGLLSVWLVSADTFGTLDTVAEQVDGARACRVRTGADKVRAVDQLGPRRCVAVGNGANDAGMLTAAALALVVIGAEGASGRALAAADLVFTSVTDALACLRDPRLLAASLRP